MTRFTGGFPIPLGESQDDFSLTGSSNTDVPDLVGKVHTMDPRKPGNLYNPLNPDAFAPGQLGQFGTSSRQFFHGPGINNFDVSLMKKTQISESIAFEISS